MGFSLDVFVRSEVRSLCANCSSTDQGFSRTFGPLSIDKSFVKLIVDCLQDGERTKKTLYMLDASQCHYVCQISSRSNLH